MPNADLLPTPGDIFAYPSDDPQYYGMTLRDHFAGQANAAWVHVLSMRRSEPGYSDESAAEYAAHLAGISADAMIAARRPK